MAAIYGLIILQFFLACNFRELYFHSFIQFCSSENHDRVIRCVTFVKMCSYFFFTSFTFPHKYGYNDVIVVLKSIPTLITDTTFFMVFSLVLPFFLLPFSVSHLPLIFCTYAILENLHILLPAFQNGVQFVLILVTLLFFSLLRSSWILFMCWGEVVVIDG